MTFDFATALEHTRNGRECFWMDGTTKRSLVIAPKNRCRAIEIRVSHSQVMFGASIDRFTLEDYDSHEWQLDYKRNN